MKSNVVSLADYRIKKQEVLQQQTTYSVLWLPVMHLVFVPPFFWFFTIK